METFIFGGEVYIVKNRLVLKGMDYYKVLENKNTGEKLYLYCCPER